MTPLGEWSRNRRWGLTMTGYVIGSLLSGSTVGAAFGAFGAAAGASALTAPTLIGFSILAWAGILTDLDGRRFPLPTLRRQVSQSWPYRLRGFVYGTGFGLQLGAGLTTVVTNSATYLLFVGIFLEADLRVGLVAGGMYGLARAGVNFATVLIRTPAQLAEIRTKFESLYNPVRFSCAAVQAALAAALALSVSLKGG